MMEKLSSEKTFFLRKMGPYIAILSYIAVVFITIIGRFFIAIPVLLLFLVGLIRFLITSSRIVDFYIDSANQKIEIDNLFSKRLSYTIKDLVSIKHNAFFSFVDLEFRDKGRFRFYTRNLWAVLGFDEPSVDKRINRIIEAKKSITEL